MILNRRHIFLLSLTAVLTLTGCKDTKSFSDLLKDEQEAVNWYLSGNRVEISVPEDNDFEVGPNAPYYRMDEDGYIYMQVINKGDVAESDPKPEPGDVVYFRFRRKNIEYMYQDIATSWEGNMDDLNPSFGSPYFVFGNYQSDNSLTYGSGIQLPLNYLGYNSEVNLVVRSYYGFVTDQSNCVPYLINVKYFKAEY